jgi:hypothetical protein
MEWGWQADSAGRMPACRGAANPVGATLDFRLFLQLRAPLAGAAKDGRNFCDNAKRDNTWRARLLAKLLTLE